MIAVIKSIQVAGSTVEVLAVAEDGAAYRVQTDGTLASLKAELQRATSEATERRTKPELSEGMTVDFTPDAIAAVEAPSKADLIRQDIRAAMLAELRAQRLAQFSPELEQRIIDAGMADDI